MHQPNALPANSNVPPNDPAAAAAQAASSAGKKSSYASPPTGGFYEFEDGGHYIGCWEDGKAHGFGICTGPKGQGEYAGSFDKGFEVSGVYRWPTGSKYSGQWQGGLRHGLGVEKKGSWMYKGEWNKGHKGRYGVRESTSSCAKYEGTWAQNLQDGYGIETYADTGKYTGQWVAGMRNGLGVRTSVPYGMASIIGAPQLRRASNASLTDTPDKQNLPDNFGVRGGFVLTENFTPTDDISNSMTSTLKKISLSRSTLLEGLRIRVSRKSGGGGGRRDGSTHSLRSDSSTVGSDTGSTATANGSAGGGTGAFPTDMLFEDVPTDATEIYMGEWQRDKRTGSGISERTDGVRYEGYWLNNKRHGFGCLHLKDGTKEEGKWRANKLISATNRKKARTILLPHPGSAKRAEKVERAVIDAKHAAELAKKKAEITLSRVNTAQLKADQALQCAELAQQDADYARIRAKEFAEISHRKPPPDDDYSRRRTSSSVTGGTPSPRHSERKSSINESLVEEDGGSNKDYLSVPGSERNSKSASDHDLERQPPEGRLGRRASSKEKIDAFGNKVKDKFTRISRSFRMNRPARDRLGAAAGVGGGSGDYERQNPNFLITGDFEGDSGGPLQARVQPSSLGGSGSRERSGSLPGGERKPSRAVFDCTPSWEIPSSYLPSPIMEAVSPEGGIPISPFRFDSEDPPMPVLLGSGAGVSASEQTCAAPFLAADNHSDLSQSSALHASNWYTNGEMVVFVLILNLGFTALFAHLLS